MDRKTEIELTNMCFIYNETSILVEEKLGTDSGDGLIFPGGHIEAGESIRDSVIREIKEETGLTISHVELCGVKDWILPDGSRYLVLLFKTDQYEGELKSSGEGRVFWLDRKDIKDAKFIWNARELLEIFEGDAYCELFFRLEREDEEDYHGELLG